MHPSFEQELIIIPVNTIKNIFKNVFIDYGIYIIIRNYFRKVGKFPLKFLKVLYFHILYIKFMNIDVQVIESDSNSLSKQLIQFMYETNQSNIPALGSLNSLGHVKELFVDSKYIISVKNEIDYIGFAVVMNNNSNYKSLNYQYFKRKYTDFLYIDRVAVVNKAQRMGVGSSMYKKLYELNSEVPIPICCEVNTIPLNQQSLDFHSKQKFIKIEEVKFGKKRVAMLVKY